MDGNNGGLPPTTTTGAAPDAPAPADVLLTPDFLRKLEHLSLALSRVFAGRLHGERRSTNRGASVEFADFRNYALGDDLRYVDWNVAARLDKLFLKMFVEEEDLHVHLLLDTSRSMAFGTPRKLLVAQRIVAALGYIALCNYDRVSVTALTDRLAARLPAVHGRPQAFRLFEWLQGLQAEGQTDFSRVLHDYALLARRPGLLIIVSDFMTPGVEEGLRALVGRRFAVTLLQVLAPEEITPNFLGDLRLIDAETGEAREITVTAGLLHRYQQRLEAHRAFLEGLGTRYGVNVLRTVTTEPFEQLILRYLKERRVVQ